MLPLEFGPVGTDSFLNDPEALREVLGLGCVLPVLADWNIEVFKADWVNFGLELVEFVSELLPAG